MRRSNVCWKQAIFCIIETFAILCLLGCRTFRILQKEQSLGVQQNLPCSILQTEEINNLKQYYAKNADTSGMITYEDVTGANIVGLYINNSYFCAITATTVVQLQQYFTTQLSNIKIQDTEVSNVLYDKPIMFKALEGNIDTEFLKTYEEVVSKFESETIRYKEYEIKPNDTIESIAKDLNITCDELKTYACIYNDDNVYLWYTQQLLVGAKIQVPYYVPYLNMQYQKIENISKYIPYATKEIYDDTMYDDEMQELVAGEYGVNNMLVCNTYNLDGVCVNQNVLETQCVQKPTTCVVKVGTKMRVQKALYTKETPKGSYVYPVEYSKSQISAYMGDGRGHKGIDIAAPYGTPVYASEAGIVTDVGTGWNGGYGNAVVIHNTDENNCRYAHMSWIVVTENTEVVKGQLIGYVGSTGDSTGNHLHFEVFTDDGVIKNPINYVYIPSN